MSSISVDDALAQAGGSIHEAAAVLWHLDVNRLRPTVDYRLDVQDRTEAYSHDAASQPFVSFVSDDVWDRPTYLLFKKLLDNYTAETGVPEVISHEEQEEEDNFVAAICETPVIQFIFGWLRENADLPCSDISEFPAFLKEIWFHHYSRDASRDSSGFEHVFCGELDDGKVKGLHNFVQVLIEEQRGHFNYLGYLDIRGEPHGDPPADNQQLITIRFEWLGETKPCSSMFVGVSPEFEFALYTLLYVSGREELEVEIGPYSARIKVYQMDGKIGTAFPELCGVDLNKLAADEYEGQGNVDIHGNADYNGSHNTSQAPAPNFNLGGAGFPSLGSAEQTTEAMNYAGAVGGEETSDYQEPTPQGNVGYGGGDDGHEQTSGTAYGETQQDYSGNEQFCGLNEGEHNAWGDTTRYEQTEEEQQDEEESTEVGGTSGYEHNEEEPQEEEETTAWGGTSGYERNEEEPEEEEETTACGGASGYEHNEEEPQEEGETTAWGGTSGYEHNEEDPHEGETTELGSTSGYEHNEEEPQEEEENTAWGGTSRRRGEYGMGRYLEIRAQ